MAEAGSPAARLFLCVSVSHLCLPPGFLIFPASLSLPFGSSLLPLSLFSCLQRALPLHLPHSLSLPASPSLPLPFPPLLPSQVVSLSPSLPCPVSPPPSPLLSSKDSPSLYPMHFFLGLIPCLCLFQMSLSYLCLFHAPTFWPPSYFLSLCLSLCTPALSPAPSPQGLPSINASSPAVSLNKECQRWAQVLAPQPWLGVRVTPWDVQRDVKGGPSEQGSQLSPHDWIWPLLLSSLSFPFC